jgi:hypothetical protein
VHAAHLVGAFLPALVWRIEAQPFDLGGILALARMLQSRAVGITLTRTRRNGAYEYEQNNQCP